MKCVATFSENNLYKLKLAKTRANVLESLYNKPYVMEPKKIRENLRLRLRFKEAIEEAQEICELDKDSSECHWAWYEVDELEDSMTRYYPDQLR
jgi:hypothetical protein